MPLSSEKRRRNQDTLGKRLRAKREKLGFTQIALAKELGLEYYTMISQMELGYISIPPALWGPLADALQFDKARWLYDCLDEYAPEVKTALFGDIEKDDVIHILDLLRKGQISNDGQPRNADC